MNETRNIDEKLAALHTQGSQPPVVERVNRFLEQAIPGCNLRVPEVVYQLETRAECIEAAFPRGKKKHDTRWVKSYRLRRRGVAHIPPEHERTTKYGVQWVVTLGQRMPEDKVPVSPELFAKLWEQAFIPPTDLAPLPYTAEEEQPVPVTVAAYLRPTLAPAIPGLHEEVSVETLVLGPGGMVYDLDFLRRAYDEESNPFTDDAGRDWQGWARKTGCVVFAPHLPRLTKKSVGLPHYDEATERQRKDGMCYRDESELLNSGKPFFVHLQLGGSIVTIVASTYQGYGKKTVMTQLGYMAARAGVFQEHSGGVVVYVDGQWVCLGSPDTPSGGGKTELGTDPVSRIRAGMFEVRIGNEWVEVQPGGLPLRWQVLDDITAGALWPHNGGRRARLVVKNTETWLFQRPDDSGTPGHDPETERAFAEDDDLYITNYEVLNPVQVQEIVNSKDFHSYTKPMQEHLLAVLRDGDPYAVCSSEWRKVNGNKMKNPRFHMKPRHDVKLRRALEARGVDVAIPHHIPVEAWVRGMRTNVPAPGVPAFCCFGPIHVYSKIRALANTAAPITGKSPSTDGILGSEGAGTRGGPFRSERSFPDLEAAIIIEALADVPAFTTVSGTIGPNFAVGQDIRRLFPCVLAKMTPEERDPEWLFQNGYLEAISDYVYEEAPYKGKLVPASLLGRRITWRFVEEFFGRVIKHQDLARAFPSEMLKPELQDPRVFAESVWNLVTAQQEAMKMYYDDGSYDDACPALQALFDITRYGKYKGMGPEHPKVQRLFTEVMETRGYKKRLDVAWEQRKTHLRLFLEELGGDESVASMIQAELERVSDPTYREAMKGTLGINPKLLQAPA